MVDVDGIVAVDKDEHPPIPVLAGYNEVVNAVRKSGAFVLGSQA